MAVPLLLRIFLLVAGYQLRVMRASSRLINNSRDLRHRTNLNIWFTWRRRSARSNKWLSRQANSKLIRGRSTWGCTMLNRSSWTNKTCTVDWEIWRRNRKRTLSKMLSTRCRSTSSTASWTILNTFSKLIWSRCNKQDWMMHWRRMSLTSTALRTTPLSTICLPRFRRK